jgi:hypothetical protein
MQMNKRYHPISEDVRQLCLANDQLSVAEAEQLLAASAEDVPQ